MPHCWRCQSRFLVSDGAGDVRCGCCARPQAVPPILAIAPNVESVAPPPVDERFSYQCQQCGMTGTERYRSAAARRRFCSRSCRTRYQNAQRRMAKPWQEIVLR